MFRPKRSCRRFEHLFAGKGREGVEVVRVSAVQRLDPPRAITVVGEFCTASFTASSSVMGRAFSPVC